MGILDTEPFQLRPAKATPDPKYDPANRIGHFYRHDVLSLNEAADLLGVRIHVVQSLAEEGCLVHRVSPGGHLMFPAGDLVDAFWYITRGIEPKPRP